MWPNEAPWEAQCRRSLKGCGVFDVQNEGSAVSTIAKPYESLCHWSVNVRYRDVNHCEIVRIVVFVVESPQKSLCSSIPKQRDLSSERPPICRNRIVIGRSVAGIVVSTIDNPQELVCQRPPNRRNHGVNNFTGVLR